MSSAPSGTREAFDDARREWDFERVRDEHRDCCIGAMDLNGWWVNVLAGSDPRFIRGWDEPYEIWAERSAASTATKDAS